MTPRPATGSGGRGLVLVRGSAAASARWLRRGLVAVSTTELEGWTAVTLAESAARARAPYDVGLEVLAARPIPSGRRPALGFFDIDGSAVMTVQPRGWRARQRWLVWQPGHGVRRTPELPALPLSMVIATADASARTTPARLGALLATTVGRPVDLLVSVMEQLGLPGSSLLIHPAEGPVIEPHPRTVRRFDDIVADQGRDHA